MSGLWPQLLNKFDASLRDSLTLERAIISRNGEKLLVKLNAQRLLNEKEFQAVRGAFGAGFPGVKVSVRVAYPALYERAKDDITQYAVFLSELVAREYPGAVPYIVWEDADWKLKGDKLRIRVKDRIGAAYLEKQAIDKRLEELIKELFLLACHVTIEVYGDEEERLKQIAEKRIQEQERLAGITLAMNKAEAGKKPAAPRQLIGKTITDPVIPVSELTDDTGRAALAGELINCELRDVKNGASKLMTFAITDYTGSLQCKAFLGGKRAPDAESLAAQAEAIEGYCKPGAWVKVRGDFRYDDFQKEMVLMVRDMMRADAPVREDTAPEKRVELHLHTQMSAMDACASPTDLIAQAAAWGHKAIAITDHGVVQAFPEAFGAAKKKKIKLIPGCEGYLVDDYAKIVQRADDRLLSAIAFVVLDVETTGLNTSTDDIIELGAVRIENGAEVAEFSTLINPNRPISAKITEITGISDGMVHDMPSIGSVMNSFADFCAGAVLVAHNADFDMAFMKRAFTDAGFAFEYPALDTLALSRNQLPKLRSHKLGTLCKHYKISLTKAHRAVHDARATSELMMALMREAGAQLNLQRLSDLNKAYTGNAGGSSNHIILLAATQDGIANLNRLVSEAHLNYFYKTPRMPRSLIEKWRDGLIIGSACEAGELYRAVLDGKSDEELLQIAKFYDYLEIQPLGNNDFLIRNGKVKDIEALKDINRKIVRLADELQIPCVATGDVHFKEPQDSTYRAILMAAKGFEDADEQAPLYFKTTDEMLEEFSYLGKDTAYRVVVEAPNEIADRVEKLNIFIKHPEGKETFQPHWEEAEDDIRNISLSRAHELYGDPLPDKVQARLDKELGAIIRYGFATLYDIAVKLVRRSMEDGYIVGSRGSIGSSFVAFLTDITEVNALPPHYVCPKCKRTSFTVPEDCTCGLDLPEQVCPDCGAVMHRDGYDIPFEVFLGFEGDKVPDIDLNFSGEYQPRAHAYVKELFGAENVFRAGTIGTVAEKTAYGYVLKYLEERGLTATSAEKERLAHGMTGVKRTTGQHPAGMVVLPKDYEIYQFTAIQHPADDLDSDTITTHFDFSSMHDVLVKLDVLGHDDPTMLRKLQDLTGIAPQEVPLYDAKVFKDILSLFTSPAALGVNADELGSPTGTLGIPEFGTKFVRQMLVDTQPRTMEELLRISGLSHGTDVWLGNAQDIIRSGTAPLRRCICTRDDIMNQLMKWGVPDKISFDTMESVRKGRGLTPVMEEAMRAHDTPEWYIECCKKIKYMFPKAHAAAYVLMALRIAYFKIYYPIEYYACYLKRNAEDFDGSKMIVGLETLRGRQEELAELEKDEKAKKEGEISLLEVLVEMHLRGVKILPISLYGSHPEDFLITAERMILPPLNSLPGLGLNAAQKLAQVRGEGAFISQEDMVRRKVPKSVVEMLRVNGCLKDMPETSQVSLFDF